MHPVIIAISVLWLTLPALLPNSAAVIFGGGAPVDMGRSWGGSRLLGDGKTWTGLMGGTLSGLLLGMMLYLIATLLGLGEPWDFGGFPDCLVPMFSLALGSLLGDIGGSFLKRRIGLARGAKAPVLDQYDFLIGAYGLTLLTSTSWFMDHLVNGGAIYGLLFVVILTPLLHRLVNVLGYKMGAKDVPW